jgi:hypothetical protein
MAKQFNCHHTKLRGAMVPSCSQTSYTIGCLPAAICPRQSYTSRVVGGVQVIDRFADNEGGGESASFMIVGPRKSRKNRPIFQPVVDANHSKNDKQPYNCSGTDIRPNLCGQKGICKLEQKHGNADDVYHRFSEAELHEASTVSERCDRRRSLSPALAKLSTIAVASIQYGAARLQLAERHFVDWAVMPLGFFDS